MQVTTSFLLPLSTSLPHSLRCRRLEVVNLCTDCVREIFSEEEGTSVHRLGSSVHEKKRACEKETRDIPCVSPSRTPVLSFAHYFQAPATQPPSHRDVLGASWRVLAPSTFVQQI